MKKIIILFVSIFYTFPLFAQSGTYVGVAGNFVQQRGDDDQGVNNKLKGNGYTLYLGHRAGLFSAEAFYKSTSTDTSVENMNFEYSDTAIGVGGRFHLISIFSLRAGALKHNADIELKVEGNDAVETFKATGISPYFGLGLQKRFSQYFNFYADFISYKVKDDDVDNAHVLYSDFEIGIRLFF